MKLGLIMALASMVLLACSAAAGEFGTGDTEDFIDMNPPPSNCSAGTGAEPCPPSPDSSGSPEGGPCIDSQDCLGGNACVAPFEGGQVGDFTCSSECIASNDEAAWCLDASACCDPAAVCIGRGLCVPGGSIDSGTGSETGGSGSSGTGASSGSGGTEGSSSGSDTGAATGTTGMR